MTAGVYAIINTVTGHRYIGSTKDFETRRQAHLTALRTDYVITNKRLTAALHAYGVAAFSIEMIELVEPDESALETAERRWITYYAEIDRERLYNVELTGRRPKMAAPCQCSRCLKRREKSD